MLQRFQTLLLLIAFILLVLLFLLPLAYLPQEVKIYCYEIRPLLLLSLVTTVATVATIPLYKARILQIRISIFNAILLTGLQGWIVYYVFVNRIPDAAFSLTAVFPLAAAILTVLAIRYIGRDEATIRSWNRLRK